MTSSGTAVVTLPADDQILITREFAARPDQVFKAWTEPELISKWWPGLRGKMTLCEVDLRVGGKWRYVMEANGGFEVAFHGEYREIVTNERLVSTEAYEGAPDSGETINTLTLDATDAGTRMEVLVQAPSREVRDAIIDSGMEGGMQEGMDILEQIAVSLS